MIITHGELFAGIGGFGLGFDNAGMLTVWHVDIDKNCQNVLRRHNPDRLILSDVCEVGKHNLPYVDVISFGSPCQDLSIAGKRKGLIDGTRSNLFFEAVRIVDELKPVIAVWENVPGALSSNSGRDFAQVLGAFRDIGARDIAWRILDAQYFGVAQRRRRVFVIADFRGERAAEVLFEREGMSGDTPARRKAGEEVAYSIRANPSHSGDKGDGGINTTMVAVAPTLDENYFRKRYSNQQFFSQNGDVFPIVSRDLAFGGNNTSGEIEVATACNAHGGTGRCDFESETYVVTSPTGLHEQPIIAWDRQQITSKTNRSIMRSEYCHTLNNAGQMMIGVRCLTPTECERLQGFPDGYTSWGIDKNGERVMQSDSTRYSQLGNAVAVPVVEWIGRRLNETHHL